MTVSVRPLETLLVERRDRVAIVTLNRPEARNAMNGVMFAELSEVLEELSNDGSVRAMVLTGAGKAFCAGADVNDPFFSGADRSMRVERAELGYGVVRKLHEAPFVLVAAINGSCVATGVSLAALCDIRIASSAVTFHFGFARVGIFPDLAGSVVLPRLLGTARAIELTLLDDPIDAARAVEIGLITQAVPSERLFETALAVAQTLAGRSPIAVRLSRQAMTELATLPFNEALDVEAEMVVTHAESFDLAEGIAAVREQRAPQFLGR